MHVADKLVSLAQGIRNGSFLDAHVEEISEDLYPAIEWLDKWQDILDAVEEVCFVAIQMLVEQCDLICGGRIGQRRERFAKIVQGLCARHFGFGLPLQRT